MDSWELAFHKYSDGRYELSEGSDGSPSSSPEGGGAEVFTDLLLADLNCISI
jgi:hypothetical protein